MCGDSYSLLHAIALHSLKHRQALAMNQFLRSVPLSTPIVSHPYPSPVSVCPQDNSLSESQPRPSDSKSAFLIGVRFLWKDPPGLYSVLRVSKPKVQKWQPRQRSLQHPTANKDTEPISLTSSTHRNIPVDSLWLL